MFGIVEGICFLSLPKSERSKPAGYEIVNLCIKMSLVGWRRTVDAAPKGLCTKMNWKFRKIRTFQMIVTFEWHSLLIMHSCLITLLIHGEKTLIFDQKKLFKPLNSTICTYHSVFLLQSRANELDSNLASPNSVLSKGMPSFAFHRDNLASSKGVEKLYFFLHK